MNQRNQKELWDAFERPEVERRRGSSSSTTITSPHNTLIEPAPANPNQTIATGLIKIIDIQKTSNSNNDLDLPDTDQEQRRGFRNSYQPTGSQKQQVSQASGRNANRSNGSRSAQSSHHLPEQQQQEQQPIQQQSGEILSSFESDYDLLLYIGETETEDIVDTEQSLDYQDQTWRASVCGGASLAPTIDGSLSELVGSQTGGGGGHTPEFDLLEYDSTKRLQARVRQHLSKPTNSSFRQPQVYAPHDEPADDCDQEVSRLFSSLVNQKPTTSTLDRHKLKAHKGGEMDQEQQRSRTLDRRHEPQVSTTEDLDKLLAEMSNSIDLNALARFDSNPRTQALASLTGATGDTRSTPSGRITNNSSKTTSNIGASSESILEELDGASRMLEQMIAEQFPSRQRGKQYPNTKQESMSSCESPRSVISNRHHQIPPHQLQPQPAVGIEAVSDNSRVMLEPKPIVNEEVHLIPIKVGQKEEESSKWIPKRSSLKAARPREEPPPPPPLPERDYDTGSQNIVPLEPDTYPEEERERSQMNKMKHRTLSSVRRMREKIGDFMGHSLADTSNERQSRSLRRGENQEASLGTQLRERLSRSRSRVSGWWQKGTRWTKRAQSTPNTKTTAQEDSELFQPNDIARVSGQDSPVRLEHVGASMHSVNSSGSEGTHVSGLEAISKRPSRSSRRSNKNADSSGRQGDRATSLLSLKRFSSSLRSPTPAPKEDFDSMQVNVKNSKPKAVERRRRKRKGGTKSASECSSGGQSDTSALVQVSEKPPETQQYFSQVISSRGASANSPGKGARKSQSLKSVSRSRASSLTSLGNNNTRAGNRLAPAMNTFRPISALANAEQRPVSVVSDEPTRTETITPVGPMGRSESTDPKYDLLKVDAAPVGRTKSATMLSEFKQKCSNLLRVGRTKDTARQPKRPPRRSKSIGQVEEEEKNGIEQVDQKQKLDSDNLCDWKPVIESKNSGKSFGATGRQNSRQLESSASEKLLEASNNPRQQQPQQFELPVVVGLASGPMARRLSLDTESTWESSDQEAELGPTDSPQAPFQPDVSRVELEPSKESHLAGAEPARIAKTTATSGSSSSATVKTTKDPLAARAQTQTLGAYPLVEHNYDVKQVQQVALNRQQQVAATAAFAIAPRLSPPTQPPPPPLSKPTPPPRLLAAPIGKEKTCRKLEGNNMKQGAPVGGEKRLVDAKVDAANSADLWRFKFNNDLPEPDRILTSSSWDPQASSKLNEKTNIDDDEDERRFSTYENVQPDSTANNKLSSWPPSGKPEDAPLKEPPKPPRISLADKPPKPEKKLIKMLSIIQDPNDDLMVARGASGATSSGSKPLSGGGARCDSIRSLASVFDGTLSNGTLNNYNSDSESSLVAPRQKLLAKFEQQAPLKQPPKPAIGPSARAGVFGGQKAGSRVKRLAKTFDQGTAPINEECLKPDEEPRSEAVSVASWHDAEQLDEAEVAKFLEELDNSHASVSTGAEPFVTVADSVGLEGAEDTRAETIVSDQEDDNTLNEEQLADEENLGSPEWQVAGESRAVGNAVAKLTSQVPISAGMVPPSLGTTSPEFKQNEKGPCRDKDQNDNVINLEPPSTGNTARVTFNQPPVAVTSTSVIKRQDQDEFKSSLNRLIGRRISVPLANGEHPRKHQQQQVSMTTGHSLEVPLEEDDEVGKSKSPSSELRGLSRYYRALLNRRKRQHNKSRQRSVLDDSIQSSSSSSSCSGEGSSSEEEEEDDSRTERFCEKLERMLASKVATQKHQADDARYSCKDSLSGDEPGSLSSSSAVSYESIPEVRQRQVLQKLYNTVREIHSSEAKFVETLKLLNEDLRKHIEGVPSQQSECLHRLLRHLPQLQALNESLLAELKTACDKWPQTRKIAHVLVKMGPFLKHYSAYIREFDSVQQQLVDCNRRWPLLADRLRSFEATDKCQKLSVQHHLLRPVQRIPQYRLMLQQYLTQLKPDDPDYEDTVSALEVVSRVAEHANQSMSEGINSAKLLALQAKVVGKQRDIVQPGRLFIKEGELLKMSRKQPQPRWFVLLSDALLYLTQTQSSDLLYLNNEFPIDDCQVSTPSEQLIGDQFHSEFHVRTSQRSFALIARSRQERDDWVAAIHDTADKYLARRRSLKASQSSRIGIQESPDHQVRLEGSSPDSNNITGGESTNGELLGQRAPLWTPDSRVSMCQLCTSNFSALFRRHHCRACGKVVCSVCSSNRAPLMYLKCRQARVCDHCFHLLKANLHLYYLGADQQRSADANTDSANLRKLDEHFRTLLRSQFVRGSLLRGRSSIKGNSHQSHRTELSKLKKLGDNDSGCAISGYLHRRRPSKSKWKRRWFVIQEKVLYEYRAIDDVAPMSSLPLLGYQVDQPQVNIDGLEARSLIRLWHQSSHSTGNNNKTNTDTSKTASSPIEHLFKAESVGAAERWLDAFSRSLKLEHYGSDV